MVSIIVPTLNRPDSLKRCLDSIKKYTKDYELIVVDGIEHKTKCYSEAMNIGLKKAKGDFLTIPGIANDIEVTEGWMDEMLKYMRWNKKVGMGVFTVLRKDLSIESFGWFVKPERYNNDPFGYPDYCGYGLVRREVFEKVGMMDEEFKPIYCEDADYGLRVWEEGYKIGVCPTAKIIHHHEKSERTNIKQENRDYLLKKHDKNRRIND